MFNCIMAHNANPNTKPRMNATPMKHLSADEMIATHHVRHIFTPINQIIKKLIMLCNILLNVTFLSHPTNHGCYK